MIAYKELLASMDRAGAREGICELILELGKSQNLSSNNILLSVLSMKWVHLIATGCEPPRTVLIRPFDEFTVGYTTQSPSNHPAFDNHAEVVRHDDGRLHFRVEHDVLTVGEFAQTLISLLMKEVPSRD
jgi:hypothetical protein